MRIRNATRAALAIFICATAGFMPAATAQANSALDQYVEEVPDVDGGDKGDGKKNQETVDPKRVRELASRGEAGQALLALAESTAPSGAGTDSSSGKPDGQKRDGANGQAGNVDSSLDATALDRARGAGSIQSAAVVSGVSVPLFIFVFLLAAAMGLTAWLRRSRGGERG